jgi:hypothetical protein
MRQAGNRDGLDRIRAPNAPEARSHQLRRRDLTLESRPRPRRRLSRRFPCRLAGEGSFARSMVPRPRCSGAAPRVALRAPEAATVGWPAPAYSEGSDSQGAADHPFRHTRASDAKRRATPVSRPDRLGSAPRWPERALHRRTRTRRHRRTSPATNQAGWPAGTRPGEHRSGRIPSRCGDACLEPGGANPARAPASSAQCRTDCAMTPWSRFARAWVPGMAKVRGASCRDIT